MNPAIAWSTADKDEIMAPNHKLTALIKGRTVVGTSHDEGKTIVTFDDGSTMRVKTLNEPTPAPMPIPNPQNESWLDKITHAFSHDDAPKVAANAPVANAPDVTGMVKEVMQNDTTLVLQFEDGGPMEIALAEASSSVMLRAQDETMEYAD